MPQKNPDIQMKKIVIPNLPLRRSMRLRSAAAANSASVSSVASTSERDVPKLPEEKNTTILDYVLKEEAKTEVKEESCLLTKIGKISDHFVTGDSSEFIKESAMNEDNIDQKTTFNNMLDDLSPQNIQNNLNQELTNKEQSIDKEDDHCLQNGLNSTFKENVIDLKKADKTCKETNTYDATDKSSAIMDIASTEFSKGDDTLMKEFNLNEVYLNTKNVGKNEEVENNIKKQNTTEVNSANTISENDNFSKTFKTLLDGSTPLSTNQGIDTIEEENVNQDVGSNSSIVANDISKSINKDKKKSDVSNTTLKNGRSLTDDFTHEQFLSTRVIAEAEDKNIERHEEEKNILKIPSDYVNFCELVETSVGGSVHASSTVEIDTIKEGQDVDNIKDDEHCDSNLDEASNNAGLLNSKKENGKWKVHDIDFKIDELQSNFDYEFVDSETEQNSFIDIMAEEGEEDTPSEGSNDIIEVGEEINTTESEISSDRSYENNSFIDDEENYQLLSGDEYDLSLGNSKKRKRIIIFSSGSDEGIVYIKRNEETDPKKRKKSRIIRCVDSSDEETAVKSKGCEKGQNINKWQDAIKLEMCDNDELHVLDDFATIQVKESSNTRPLPPEINTQNDSPNVHSKDYSIDTHIKHSTKELNLEKTNPKINSNNTEETLDSCKGNLSLENTYKKENRSENDENSIGKVHKTLASTPVTNSTHSNENLNKKIIIIEDIKVDEIIDKNFSNHINSIIQSVCTVTKKNLDPSTDSCPSVSESDINCKKNVSEFACDVMIQNLDELGENIEMLSTGAGKSYIDSSKISEIGNMDNNVLKLINKRRKNKERRKRQKANKKKLNSFVNYSMKDLKKSELGKRKIIGSDSSNELIVKKRKTKMPENPIKCKDNGETKMSILDETVSNNGAKCNFSKQDWKIHKAFMKPSETTQLKTSLDLKKVTEVKTDLNKQVKSELKKIAEVKTISKGLQKRKSGYKFKRK